MIVRVPGKRLSVPIIAIWIAPIGIAVLVATFALHSGPKTRGGYFVAGLDFRALYCGGAVVSERRNPYRVEPLRTCENSKKSTLRQHWAVLPAPYPGYALALFSLLSYLPYALAKAIWLGLLAGAVAVCAILLARISGWSLLTVSLALLPTALLGNLIYGSTPPIAMLGLTLAAVAASARKPALAAPPLAVAMIDPHLALPSAIALVLREPRARVSAAVCLVILVLLSIFAIGISGSAEYFRETLPLQARAEVFDNYQYSLTHVLAILGFSSPASLALGSISYVLLALGAVLFACREPSTGDGPARAVLLPVAAAALGGTYMHYQEVSLALPAAFILARAATSGTARMLLAVGFAGILYSPEVDNFRVGFVPYVLACVAVGASLWPMKRFTAAAAAFALALVVALSIHALPHYVGKSHVTAVRATPAPAIAAPNAPFSPAWGAYIASTNYDLLEDPRLIGIKVPTWCGLVALLILAVRSQRPARAITRERSPDQVSGIHATGKAM